MNRRGFFQTIGFGAIAAAVAAVFPTRKPVAKFREMISKLGKLGEGCRKMRDATSDATVSMRRWNDRICESTRPPRWDEGLLKCRNYRQTDGRIEEQFVWGRRLSDMEIQVVASGTWHPAPEFCVLHEWSCPAHGSNYFAGELQPPCECGGIGRMPRQQPRNA